MTVRLIQITVAGAPAAIDLAAAMLTAARVAYPAAATAYPYAELLDVTAIEGSNNTRTGVFVRVTGP